MTKDLRSAKGKVDEGKRGEQEKREEECFNSIYIYKTNLSELFSQLRSGNARDRTTKKDLPVFATIVGVAFVDNAKDKNKLV